MFYIDYLNGCRVVKSDLLIGLSHFFTTRDLCIFSKNEDMSKNKKIIEDFLGKSLSTNIPIHGINIEKVKKDGEIYKNADALLIEGEGACFMNFADCVPLIFYCKSKNVAMISHAGWRGTVQKIAKISVNRIVSEYNIRLEDIKVVIGPAICQNCYNVGADVYEELLNTVNNHCNLFLKKDNKFYVDLKGINKQQLLECGVREENIDVCPYCTACGEKLFFSYRYENKTGYRHSAVVKL